MSKRDFKRYDRCDGIAVTHRFIDRGIHPKTQTLIVGTFNPEAEENPATFFYSRDKNHLWRLLPTALGLIEDMKSASTEDKMQFIMRHKIDFVDLISEVCVEKGSEARYADDYLDKRVTRWRNVIEEIASVKDLKRVCVTRKTYSKIPNLKARIQQLQEYCDSKKIAFRCLSTPARFWCESKQNEWNEFFRTETSWR